MQARASYTHGGYIWIGQRTVNVEAASAAADRTLTSIDANSSVGSSTLQIKTNTSGFIYLTLRDEYDNYVTNVRHMSSYRAMWLFVCDLTRRHSIGWHCAGLCCTG